MIQITPNLSIDENDIQYDFVRASGPGGQNVNKVATAVQLRFDVEAASLPNGVRHRLKKLAGNRLTNAGELLLTAREHRTQERNRQTALNRLIHLIRRATEKPKRRKKTKPSRAARERRLEKKRRRSEKKARRKSPRRGVDY